MQPDSCLHNVCVCAACVSEVRGSAKSQKNSHHYK